MDNQCLKVENIVAKREIAHHEQFLLLPQCFQVASESVCMRERIKMLNPFPYMYLFSRLLFKTMLQKEKLLIMSNYFFYHT